MKRSKRISSSITSKPIRPKKRQTVEELRELQRVMASAVMRPLTSSEQMQPVWTDGRPAEKVVAGFIKPNLHLSSLERLEIYNRQYWYRIIDCFFDDYPGLRTVLGQRKFLQLTLAYLERHPSTSFTLRNLGQYLLDFIEMEPDRTRPRAALALEMARLEWAYIEAFDKEAKPSMNLDDLFGRSAGDIRLRLQPYITLLALNYPLDDFLIALHRNSGLRGEASNAVGQPLGNVALNAVPLPKRKSVFLAVHRYNNRVFYKRLRPLQFELLVALKREVSLEQALQSIAGPVRPNQIKAWFSDWSALGWFWLQSEL
jgi:hypothetical protein